MVSPNNSLRVAEQTVGAAGDAWAEAIGEIFDVPEANLEGQLIEMTSGDTSYQKSTAKETTSDTNANANDDGLDAALIDLLPF